MADRYPIEEYGKRGYLNSDFRIFHLKDQLANEFEFHYHEFHKITIFLRGNVRYFIEGACYELEPYDIVLVNRNDIHRVETDASVPYERIIVYISPGFMETYRTDEYDLSDCFLHVGSRNIDRIMFCIVCISDTCQHVSDRIGDMHAVNLLLAQLCSYQLAFLTPGICPLYASSLKQMRQTPNLRR